MSLSLGAILAIASAISGAVGDSEDEANQKEYEEKVKAWERENERIAAANQAREYKRQRRQTMARATGSDIPLMPTQDTPLNGRSTLPDRPDQSKWSDVSGTLGTIGGIAGNIGSDFSDVPIIGSAQDAYQGAISRAADNAYSAGTAWSAPDVGKQYSTYNYTDRYTPKQIIRTEP